MTWYKNKKNKEETFNLWFLKRLKILSKLCYRRLKTDFVSKPYMKPSIRHRHPKGFGIVSVGNIIN